ncbi:glutamyl-tRNA amidotransferase [candidate division MSBL1 archaeon SCGC-AAA833F18]|uniref:Glutamyl-tRNA(Gln) amidotransferase subunit E n=2 Tax=candidate division MSBL1 TaxID=215777 RepID=A0A133VSU5_9EURY|nr:glutamyl-tRNA amidotransferase [candidate division MSBL1 archaeon SCGC-AAA261O19]KXB09522.1 glutamyl-tRNA amidotransferase [candidate division MSBL1 archaeon SCGC-AAA833F18]
MTEFDYDELGLLVGFEIHQELDTHKLFCNCPSELREEEPPLAIDRELRPTQSELGEIDQAALAEAAKRKWFRYKVHPDNVCLVEMDEEPPHSVNKEAQEIGLEIALLLNATPVDEAHVMRKTVIDGSNTAGFQRTILMATDGKLEINGIKVDIPTICLEEDAARKAGEEGDHVDYQLDRLGIPLIEIATGPNFTAPKMAETAALKIGQILRATGKVKRGIGTIRQDINVSIEDGARQEIKGVQELSLISNVIELEVERQVKLLEIKNELEKRGAKRIEEGIIDVTKIFSDTKSKILQEILSKDGLISAVKLPKFAGLIGKELTPNRRFGTELADYAKVYSNVKGIFHTDELPGDGISSEEVRELKNAAKASEEDAVIIIGGKEGEVKKALKAVVERANAALEGVPEETRRALVNGTTQFMRPLPGAARMYVETDIPPLVVSQVKLKKIKEKLPELPEERKEKYVKEFDLSEELARRMSVSENAELFEKLVEKHDADPTLVAATLEETLPYLEKEGLDAEKIGEEELDEIISLISQEEISKSALMPLLEKAAQGVPPKESIKQLGLEKMERGELEELITQIVDEKKELIEERGDRAIAPLMGIVMERVRGKADGELVHELLEEKLRKYKT